MAREGLGAPQLTCSMVRLSGKAKTQRPERSEPGDARPPYAPRGSSAGGWQAREQD